MYVGRYRGTSGAEAPKEKRSIHIPENYAGNVFTTENVASAVEADHEQTEACMAETYPIPSAHTHSEEKGRGFLQAERFFSSDTLLVFLAILLFGHEDGNELSIILLLLLLF